MPKATENLISFPQESSVSCLDEILRNGAREMLGRAIEDEVAVFVGARSELVDENGHRLVPPYLRKTKSLEDSSRSRLRNDGGR